MNFINFIKILLLNLLTLTSFNNKKDEPVRLAKKEESWLQRNHDKIMVILTSIILVLCFLIFILICFIVGGTESGKYYNHLGDSI